MSNESPIKIPDGWIEDDFKDGDEYDLIDRLSNALDQVTQQINSQEFIKKHRLQERREQIISLLDQQYKKIDQRLKRDAKTVLLRDKISFVVGVANSCIAPALSLRYPYFIPFYYTLQFTVLFVLRYLIYRSRQWHYFIFDNCYFVNIMTILFCFVFSDSRILYIATFTLTNGPVAYAIITWRNSLVFHSLDKVTSLFIHIFPPLVMYCIRWMPELLNDSYCGNLEFVTRFRDERYPGLDTDITIKEIFIYATTAFAIWQTLYYVFVMIKRREKVESGLRLTSYSWLLGDGTGKGFIQKAAFIFGPKWKLEMFVLLQTIYSVLTFIPAYFLHKYFWLHSMFLIVMFAVSAWNGANYYIEIFSRRYIIELEKIKKVG